jgi:hypothetical protein
MIHVDMSQSQQQADANAAAEEGEPFLGSGRLGNEINLKILYC